MDHPKGKLFSIRMIHFALIGGLVLFTGVAGYLITYGFDSTLDPDSTVGYIPYLVVIVAYPMATTLFKGSLRKISKDSTVSTKISQFNTAHIVQMAVYEGSALLSTVIALLTGKLILLAIPVVFILLMLLSTPTAFKLEQLLGLTPEEKAELS